MFWPEVGDQLNSQGPSVIVHNCSPLPSGGSTPPTVITESGWLRFPVTSRIRLCLVMTKVLDRNL